MPPAGDQGAKGSCWAWATAYVVRSTMDNPKSFVDAGKLNLKTVYSPEYVYQFYKGDVEDCNWGALSWQMLTKILDDGAVKFSDFGYDEQACNKRPSQSLISSASRFEKKGYKVQVVSDLFSIKKVLSEGQPLVISIMVDDYFCTAGNITRESPFWQDYHTRLGNHAMVVVGYNDRLKALKVLNSWGSKFADEGYVWISYSIVNSAMNYCCYPYKELESLPVTSNSNAEENQISVQETSSAITTWFKQGYHRKFDGMKIVLAKLSPSKEFAVIEIRDEQYNLKTNFYIEVKSSKEFFVDDTKYSLTLDNIDRAGRNPFDKAAYFTISRLN
jgi:C1A family cysteine protease